MALQSYGLYSHGPTKLWPYTVMAYAIMSLHSYGHIYTHTSRHISTTGYIVMAHTVAALLSYYGYGHISAYISRNMSTTPYIVMAYIVTALYGYGLYSYGPI